MMKRNILFSTVLLAAAATTSAAHAQFTINLPGFGLSLPAPPGVGVNIGLPVVPVAPYPYQPAPAAATYTDEYDPAEVAAPPDFVAPPELGFYVAVGVPYDLFFFNSLYYLFWNNCWYSSSYYNGPWRGLHHNYVPYALHRHPFDRIHHYRDNYYRSYQRYGSWSGHRHFRPEARAGGRGGYDRARYGSARPNDYGRTYGDRTPYNRQSFKGTSGSRYDYGNRSSYGRENNSTNRSYRSYGSRPDTTVRSYSPNQGYRTRSNYGNPMNATRSFGNRPVSDRSGTAVKAYPNRASYQRPDNQTHGSGNRAAYTRPMNTKQSSGNRPSSSRSNYASQISAKRPAYTSTGISGNNSGSRPSFNRSHAPNRGGAMTRTADRGNGGFGNGAFGGHARGR